MTQIVGADASSSGRRRAKFDVAAEQQRKWAGGLAEWIDGDTAYLSVVFTWRLREARNRARWYRSLGYKVRAGGRDWTEQKLTDVARWANRNNQSELFAALPDSQDFARAHFDSGCTQEMTP
mgnify:CR=1 FL=1